MKLIGRTSEMRKNTRLLLTLAALVAAAPMLTACYTTRGAGEDLSAAGKSIEHSADKNTGYKP
jgi:predicted small secreted protein